MTSLGGVDYFSATPSLRETELQRAEREMREQSDNLCSPLTACHRPETSGIENKRIASSSSSVPLSTTRKDVRETSGASTMRSSSRKVPEREENGHDDMVIEERRRRADGEGYTTHRYIRGRMLGKGGFAKVYLCTSMDTGKNYAVKIVPKANLVKARARQKLQTEIKIHRTLKHRNVCEYKHFFEDRDNCYILLELCHNQSLNEMIKRRKRLTEPEAAFFMAQLLEAVKYIHDQNVIHRDLKLGNLFLDKELNIKVGDLGLATRLEDKGEKRKTICGTPNYIAPEVIQNDKSKRGHSFEVDVWSMGVIMFTVLVGKPPYEAKDVKGTYQRILANEYSFPDHVSLSEDAKDLIQAMLQTNPSERPTLDVIERHSFLNELNLPQSLPHSCLHSTPRWSRTGFGDLVAEEDKDVSKSRLPSKSTGRVQSNRLPFSKHDANLKKENVDADEKKSVRTQRIVQQAAKVVFPTPPTHPSTFKIYDETNLPRGAERADHTSSTRSATSVSSTDNLVAKTRALTLETAKKALDRSPSEDRVPKPSTTSSSVMSSMEGKDDEMQFLKFQLERLDTVLQITEARKGKYRPLTPTSMRNGSLPEVWVTRYVDYTSKYGLGFLLNNGCSGVFFNDSTKISLNKDAKSFHYVERKRTHMNENRRMDVLVGSHHLDDFPETLNKKVTLLKHFRNYLLEQKKKDGENQQDDEFDQYHLPRDDSNLAYVKKWLRTKHAILFWLNSDIIQVVFFDQTEVILTQDESSIVYVDKLHRRKSYGFSDEVIGSFPELEKRVKYSRDILKQLLTGQRA